VSDIIQQIPVVIPRKELKPYKTPDERWEEVTKEIYGSADLPEIIHFDHDPYWDGRFWSIQNANNQSQLKTFGFWTIIGALYAFADMWWFVYRSF
jgi:hypothetical protein